MTTIKNNTEYTARAIKGYDVDNNIPGYNFSYPVANTIEIGNIIMSGGSIEIKDYKCSFDKEKSILTIERNDHIENHYISDVKELLEAMQKHFNDNQDRLLEKMAKSAAKKSQSKQGNQNAKRNTNSEPVAIENSIADKLAGKTKRYYNNDYSEFNNDMGLCGLTFPELRQLWQNLPDK